jgi:hypothetical protein
MSANVFHHSGAGRILRQNKNSQGLHSVGRPNDEVQVGWWALLRKRTLSLVDAAIETVDEFGRMNSECVADAQQGPKSDWPASFYLLPMAGRKPETNHVLLGAPAAFAQMFNSLAQSLEESIFVYHIAACNELQAKTPRAE